METWYTNKKPRACTLEPLNLSGFEDQKDLIKSLKMMLKDAKSQKVLDYKKLEIHPQTRSMIKLLL